MAAKQLLENQHSPLHALWPGNCCLCKAETEVISLRLKVADLEMGDACLRMIKEVLVKIGCSCDESHRECAPPTMYPEWIACCVRKREKRITELKTEVERLRQAIKDCPPIGIDVEGDDDD